MRTIPHVVHRGRDLRLPVNTLGKQNERDDQAGRREDDPRRWRLPELTLRLPGEQPAIVNITSRSGKGSSRRESAGLFQCNITKCSGAITSGEGVDAENAPYLMMQGVTWGVANAYQGERAIAHVRPRKFIGLPFVIGLTSSLFMLREQQGRARATRARGVVLPLSGGVVAEPPPRPGYGRSRPLA